MGHEPWGLLLKIVNIEWYIRTFFFNFNFKLYIIVLVLPNIKMNPPQNILMSSFFYCGQPWDIHSSLILSFYKCDNIEEISVKFLFTIDFWSLLNSGKKFLIQNKKATYYKEENIWERLDIHNV